MKNLNRRDDIKYHKSVLELIGNTPIVELHNVVPKNSPHRFFGKIEYLNPGLSVKDRVALAIVDGAEKRGELKPGGTLVEATSGNTGVGLAMIAAVRGYKAIFTMPEEKANPRNPSSKLCKQSSKARLVGLEVLEYS